MWYGYLADGIVTVHLAYMGFVVFGQLAIVVGKLRGWGWVRNPYFRILHFLAIAAVALEAIIHMECPLTTWEDQLREKAGQSVEQGTFVGRLMHNILFYDAPAWVFTACYITFALVVLLTLVWVPPRWRRARPPVTTTDSVGHPVRAG